ncbi:MAG: SDR family NAD(P)-dependent oxidoreductase, partial [Isosphaerales bacterium]
MDRSSEPAERTIALVTGAAQGIGLGIARSLATASYKVMLADIEDTLLEQSAAELSGGGFEVLGQHLDVTQAGEWDKAVGVVVS